MNCLERSIKEKWEPIVAGEQGVFSDCPCCKEHASNNPIDDCGRCPIKLDTGEIDCYGTPYYITLEILRRAVRSYDLMIEAKAAAQWELDYLKDLLERTNG